MPDACRPRFDLRPLLDALETAPPVEAVDVVAAELATMVGAREISFLITDFSGKNVVRFARAGTADGARELGDESAQTVPLTGTVYEQVLRRQQVDVRAHDDGACLIAPVTNRGDAIGLLELVLPSYPDRQVVSDVASAAHALSYIVIAARRYTDLFEWGQRTTPPSLAAEVQRRLLPDSFTCEAGQFTLAGWLEPSGTVGGDTFDYALDRDTLHLSITDAVGHAAQSALLATLLVGSLRNSRRRGTPLAEQAREASEAVDAHYRDGEFVTGQLIRVDLDSDTASVVNAGHPHPFLLRAGRPERVALAVDVPFGVRPQRGYRIQQLSLQPGDRVLLVTDGMLERNAARLDLFAALKDTADLHPREVVHELSHAVLAAAGGRLRDDAALLCLDWYGDSARRRLATGGAGEPHASL